MSQKVRVVSIIASSSFELAPKQHTRTDPTTSLRSSSSSGWRPRPESVVASNPQRSPAALVHRTLRLHRHATPIAIVRVDGEVSWRHCGPWWQRCADDRVAGRVRIWLVTADIRRGFYGLAALDY
jgi:hypothetical protein